MTCPFLDRADGTCTRTGDTCQMIHSPTPEDLDEKYWEFCDIFRREVDEL